LTTGTKGKFTVLLKYKKNEEKDKRASLKRIPGKENINAPTPSNHFARYGVPLKSFDLYLFLYNDFPRDLA
jgi:hypothetical protein